MNTTVPPFATAAAASQSSSSPQRKRKADNLEKPTKTKKISSRSRDLEISEEMFDEMLKKPYGPRVNPNGFSKSGNNKHGHTLYFDGGSIFCKACNKQIAYGNVVQHITGEQHSARVAKNLQEKQDALASETTGQEKIPALSDYDILPQDATDGDKKKSATNRKTLKMKAVDDEDSENQNVLNAQSGLVVNGFDIVKCVRGLVKRVSELERKLAAATSTENDSVV